MILTTRITIGICTYRRAQLAYTLASIAQVNLPLDTTLCIVVADNDDEPSAQVTVATAASEHGLDITYLHVPARNISLARNACLDAASGEYFAFIDDDELADPAWLTELLTTQRATSAEIVLGPVQALYLPTAPRWLRAGNFHSTYPVATKGGAISTGYCGNVLMKLGTPALKELHFRLDCGVTGGEDTDFFHRAHAAGAAIAYAKKAFVYEPVAPWRATLHWLLQRHYRYGQTHAALIIEANKPHAWNILLASTKMIFCYAMVILCCLMPLVRRRWLLRGTLHLAVMRTLTRTRY